jgi:phenylalanyl-tRNA synthetase alpha subunit
VLDQDKWKYARSKNDILIDDFKNKLNKWVEAGGTGILHNDATDTIRVMEEIMTNS